MMGVPRINDTNRIAARFKPGILYIRGIAMIKPITIPKRMEKTNINNVMCKYESNFGIKSRMRVKSNALPIQSPL
jgi:hypothetical protein